MCSSDLLGFLAAARHDERLAAERAQRDYARGRTENTDLVRAARPDSTPSQACRSSQRVVAFTDGMAALAVVDPTSYSAQRQRVLLNEALADMAGYGARGSRRGEG